MDDLQKYLEHECVLQQYVRKMLKKPIEEKEVINKLSISSIRQKLKIKQ